MDDSVNKQIETAERLARIETKLDLHFTRTDAVETRLKSLEAKVHYFGGGLAVLAVAAPYFIKKVFGV
jgi:hypothetical protein